MEYYERLLTRCLLLSGMHWTKAAYIVGSLDNQGIIEMLEYVAVHQELDKDGLYDTAMDILDRIHYDNVRRERNDAINDGSNPNLLV